MIFTMLDLTSSYDMMCEKKYFFLELQVDRRHEVFSFIIYQIQSFHRIIIPEWQTRPRRYKCVYIINATSHKKLEENDNN